MPDIMIDLETLGTNMKSPILSIGACEFDRTTGVNEENTFHVKIDMGCYDNLKQAFEIDYATLKWWQEQDNFRNVTDGKETLHGAIIKFKDWFSQFDQEKTQVWAQGADFDFPIFKHACSVFKISIPWYYFNQRDTRTLYAVSPGFKKGKREGVYHDALDDCKNQVKDVCRAFTLIKSE